MQVGAPSIPVPLGSSPPPAPIPTGRPFWPPPPPPKTFPAWLDVLLVVVIVIIIGASLVLFMFTDTSIGPDTPRPVVVFTAPSGLPNGFSFEVAGASMSRPASNYRVSLSVNGTSAGTAQTLVASMTIGGYMVTWSDLGGEGDLSAGDVFRVTRVPFSTNTDYVVSLLWSDGSIIGSRDYSS